MRHVGNGRGGGILGLVQASRLTQVRQHIEDAGTVPWLVLPDQLHQLHKPRLDQASGLPVLRMKVREFPVPVSFDGGFPFAQIVKGQQSGEERVEDLSHRVHVGRLIGRMVRVLLRGTEQVVKAGPEGAVLLSLWIPLQEFRVVKVVEFDAPIPPQQPLLELNVVVDDNAARIAVQLGQTLGHVDRQRQLLRGIEAVAGLIDGAVQKLVFRQDGVRDRKASFHKNGHAAVAVNVGRPGRCRGPFHTERFGLDGEVRVLIKITALVVLEQLEDELFLGVVVRGFQQPCRPEIPATQVPKVEARGFPRPLEAELVEVLAGGVDLVTPLGTVAARHALGVIQLVVVFEPSRIAVRKVALIRVPVDGFELLETFAVVCGVVVLPDEAPKVPSSTGQDWYLQTPVVGAEAAPRQNGQDLLRLHEQVAALQGPTPRRSRVEVIVGGVANQPSREQQRVFGSGVVAVAGKVQPRKEKN